MYKIINGIEFDIEGIHPAVLAKIADYCLEHCTITRLYAGDGGNPYEGPKLLPRKVVNFKYENGKVYFSVILANDKIKVYNNLGYQVTESLQEKGFLK